MTVPAPATNQLHQALVSPADPGEALAAARAAMTLAEIDGFERPVPALFGLLPYLGPDEMGDMIAARVLAGEDVSVGGADEGLTSCANLIGLPVTIHDIRIVPSTLDGDGWAGYLLCDADYPDLDGEMMRRPIAVGARQAIAVLAREHLRGNLPVRGAFANAAMARKGRSAPVTFVVESRS